MRLDVLLPRQGTCKACSDPAPCNCAANQECIQINRDCFKCGQTQCILKGSASDTGGSTHSGAVGKGATAGAIVGALIFLGIAIAAFFWYRRKMRLRTHLAAVHELPKDVPAAAETVLNRPDPTEKLNTPAAEYLPVRAYSDSHGATNDPLASSLRNSPQQTPTNPFDDTTSIQTAGTEGTNVIPIALVPAELQRPLSPASEGQVSTSSSQPVRPARSPDLNLDHVNVSRDSVRGPANYSTRSGVSGLTNRNSYMSNASFASDVLNEPPQIITPTKGAVRQVLGVVKAEVINAPASLTTSSDGGLKPPSTSRPAVGSPLASTSFGPADIVPETDENQIIDPFSDNASINAEYGVSPAPTNTTFAHSSTGAIRGSHAEWVTETPSMPWPETTHVSRPSSISTQAATSEVDIASATRVKVGLNNYDLASSQLSPDSAPRSPYRTTMGRLISPSTGSASNLQDQQQRALAQAQSHDSSRRASSGSAISVASSTHADSILEGFPIVPPSPISNRPIRSPPISPLGQQYFSPSSPLPAQHNVNVLPPSPLVQHSFSNDKRQSHTSDASTLPPPPSRRTLGLSTASQLSTASSGLGSFAFQIDSGDGPATPPNSFNNSSRQRASLDTLALTSDLSSYPLGFDRESVQMPLPQRQNHKK